MSNQYQINTDGASKGNPGPASVGVVVSQNGQIIKTYRADIGRGTNNEAEYEAVILALKKMKHFLGKKNLKATRLKFYSDSQLMVNQINHKFKIENPGIQSKFMTIWNILVDFGPVSFTYIPREQNAQADALANNQQDGLF